MAGALAAFTGVAAAAEPPPPRIFIAGDSTAQDYKPDKYPQSGWARCCAARWHRGW